MSDFLWGDVENTGHGWWLQRIHPSIALGANEFVMVMCKGAWVSQRIPHLTKKSTLQYGSQVRKALELSCTACVTAISPQNLLSPEIAFYVITSGLGEAGPM